LEAKTGRSSGMPVLGVSSARGYMGGRGVASPMCIVLREVFKFRKR
jgi:hypothetical protein